MLESTLADNGFGTIPVQMIELHLGLLTGNMIFPVILPKFSFQLPNLVLHIYQTEVSI